jgi:hypothetical protein
LQISDGRPEGRPLPLIFISFGEPKADDNSVEKHFQERSAELQIPPLRSPGFPVELGGVDELRAPFSTESRIRVVASATR